jgi:hypothetical protein
MAGCVVANSDPTVIARMAGNASSLNLVFIVLSVLAGAALGRIYVVE